MKNNLEWFRSILDFNFDLNEQASTLTVNESMLLSLFEKLTDLSPLFPDIYWLTVARLTELTVLCAGNYADMAEFTAVGDLIYNPRQILIHVCGSKQSLTKHRHQRLSEHFLNELNRHIRPSFWLSQNTLLEVQEPPLLPLLKAQLYSSGYISSRYLENIEERLNKIAQAVGFINAWQISNSFELSLKIQHAGRKQRMFIESNLCRFEKHIFHQLGEDIHQRCKFNDHFSHFLAD
jgi:hypothetical protein